MAGINKAVSTKRRSEKFLLMGLDNGIAREPVGQIGRVDVARMSEAKCGVEVHERFLDIASLIQATILKLLYYLAYCRFVPRSIHHERAR
jgi:hypothetical protein